MTVGAPLVGRWWSAVGRCWGKGNADGGRQRRDPSPPAPDEVGEGLGGGQQEVEEKVRR